jgi:hypothetical protein
MKPETPEYVYIAALEQEIAALRTQLDQAQFEIQEAKDMHLAAQRGMRRAMAERTALRDELESR